MADRTWDLWTGGNICRGIEDWRGVENVHKMLSRRGILSWVSDHWSINGRNVISTSTCSKRMNFNSSLGRSNSIAIAITIVMMGKKKEMEEEMKRRTLLIYSNWKTHWQLIVPKHPIIQHLQIVDLLKQGPDINRHNCSNHGCDQSTNTNTSRKQEKKSNWHYSSI